MHFWTKSLLLFCSLILNLAYGQRVHKPVVVTLALTSAPEGISEDEKSKIVTCVQKSFDQYLQRLSLVEENRKITSASMDAFEKLFRSNADLCKDYMTEIPEELVSLHEYTNSAYNYLEDDGIQSMVHVAKIVSMRRDVENYFDVRVHTERSMYVTLTKEEHSERYYPVVKGGGTYLREEMRYEIEHDEIEESDCRTVIGKIRRTYTPEEEAQRLKEFQKDQKRRSKAYRKKSRRS